VKICVLQPSYEGTSIDYQHYDPPRDLSQLLPGHEVHSAFLKKVSTHRQIRELRREGFDVYVNLCEGYLDWEVPSVDVIHALERFDLPYTGPNAAIYDPSKEMMKRVARSVGVKTPEAVLVARLDDVERASALRFPLFVKPNFGGDSLGIDDDSKVESPDDLRRKVQKLLVDYDEVLVEEYVPGREFTVLVAADPERPRFPRTFRPIEFVFPPDQPFKTYALKVTQSHPKRNVPCSDPELDAVLRDVARRIFLGFSAVGYARLDLRLSPTGDLYFLEVNFTCSVFYPDGSQGSADYILAADGIGQAGFLEHIIHEGVSRHRQRRKRHDVVTDSISGCGIRASTALRRGEVVFALEEQPQRLATRAHVEASWDEAQLEEFRRYAYPVPEGAHILWDRDPAVWANQNHSCDPNTAYRGLDVVALRDVAIGEELTIDYSTFCGEDMQAFQCECRSVRCRGTIRGSAPATPSAGEPLTKRRGR